MAEVDEKMEEAKQKGRNVISRHPLRTGAATMVAVFGTGFVLGHKRNQSQSIYYKVRREISNLR